MTEAGKRNEVRKFCATFFSLLGVAGVGTAFFSYGIGDNSPLFRLLASIAGFAFYWIGYYIMTRLEADRAD